MGLSNIAFAPRSNRQDSVLRLGEHFAHHLPFVARGETVFIQIHLSEPLADWPGWDFFFSETSVLIFIMSSGEFFEGRHGDAIGGIATGIPTRAEEQIIT